jgi:hypothetical protein
MAVHRERAPPLQSARGCMGKCRLSVDAKQWFRRQRKEGRLHARPSLGRVERAQRWWCGPATLVSPRLVFDRQIGPLALLRSQ